MNHQYGFGGSHPTGYRDIILQNIRYVVFKLIIFQNCNMISLLNKSEVTFGITLGFWSKMRQMRDEIVDKLGWRRSKFKMSELKKPAKRYKVVHHNPNGHIILLYIDAAHCLRRLNVNIAQVFSCFYRDKNQSIFQELRTDKTTF